MGLFPSQHAQEKRPQDIQRNPLKSFISKEWGEGRRGIVQACPAETWQGKGVGCACLLLKVAQCMHMGTYIVMPRMCIDCIRPWDD